MHKDFYKTNKKYVNFLYKNHPYFYFSFSAQLVRLCDNEDYYDPLPQIPVVIFPFFSLGENKTKLKNIFNFTQSEKENLGSQKICSALRGRTLRGLFPVTSRRKLCKH